MSKVTLQIIAQVTNQATGPLKNVQKGLKDTAAAANKTKFSFTELNRALFSTKAFFGIFSKVFNDFKTNLSEAANLDRVETSFKNVFGQNSDILTSLNNFSSIGVDRVEAMKDSISLGMLGIAKTSDDAAKILAGAAYGAKQAGVDTSEGMSKIVQGLKDGSLSGLEYLNMIRSSDPVLKAQLELLNKYSGSIGGAVTAQAKFNLIMSITNRLSQLAKGNQEDLVDSLQKLDNSFSRLKQTIGVFLGQALGGVIHSIKTTLDTVNDFIKINTKADKGLIYLAKSVIITTTAFSALYASLYAIKMISTVLASTGVGFPFLKAGVIGLAASFLIATSNADKLVDKFKLFGNFVQGIYELVSNLDTGTGLSRIDADIEEILKKNGIWTLAQNIARGISVIQAVFVEAGHAMDWFKDKINTTIKPIINLVKSLFSINGGPWSKSLVDGTSKVTKALGVLMAVASGVFLAKKFAGILGGLPVVGGLLSKIPVIGSAFKPGDGKAAGPTGNADDPIYTKNSGIPLKAGLSLLGNMKKLSPSYLIKIATEKTLGTAAKLETAGYNGAAGVAMNLGLKIEEVGAAFTTMLASISPVSLALSSLGVAIAGLAGYLTGMGINSLIKGTKADNAVTSAVGWVADKFGVEGTPNWERQQQIKNDSTDFTARIGTGPVDKTNQYQTFGLPAGAPQNASMGVLNKASIGLGKGDRVAYVPNIPTSTEQQLDLLKSTKASVEPKEKDIFTQAISQLTMALFQHLDPETTAKMTEEAYIRAMQKTKDPVRVPTARRGC